MSVPNTPIEDAKDTGLSDATQAASDDDVELEDMTDSWDDFDDDSGDNEEAAATEESKSEQSKEDDVSEEESDEESEESEDEDDSSESKDEGGDTDPEAERKRFNDEMAKRRIAEREAREAEHRAKEALEAERIKQYLADAEGDPEEVAKRQLEIESYRLQQERAQMNAERLQIGIDKALANETVSKILNGASDAAKNELLSTLDDFERYQVVKDKQGNPIRVDGDVYQTLVKKAESIRQLTQAGAVQEAKTKEKARARTITPPTRAPKESPVDPELEAFDKAWDF